MKRALACLLWMALSSPALAAVPSCTGAFNAMYFIIGDTNPSTQVYDPNRGFVVNSDATYKTWLTGFNPCAVPNSTISAAVNNGSGAARLTVSNSSSMLTGQTLQVFGTTTYDGTWSITVVDATHIDLVGSTFTATVSKGAVYGPQLVATAAAIYASVNNFNAALTRNLFTTVSLTANQVLAAPLFKLYAVTPNANTWVINLPTMNVVGAPAIGDVTRFSNNAILTSSNFFTIRNASSANLLATVWPGDVVDLVLTANGTSDGSWSVTQYPVALSSGGVPANAPYNFGTFSVLLGPSAVSPELIQTLLPTAVGGVLTDTGVGSKPNWSARGQLPATATNDNAAAGNLGEVISNSTTGNALTSSVGLNAASASLTAGDWDVQCTVKYNWAATTNVAAYLASVSSSSAAPNTTVGNATLITGASHTPGTGLQSAVPSPVVRVSLAGATNYFCVAFANFATSTATADGLLVARRRR